MTIFPGAIHDYWLDLSQVIQRVKIKVIITDQRGKQNRSIHSCESLDCCNGRRSCAYLLLLLLFSLLLLKSWVSSTTARFIKLYCTSQIICCLPNSQCGFFASPRGETNCHFILFVSACLPKNKRESFLSPQTILTATQMTAFTHGWRFSLASSFDSSS